MTAPPHQIPPQVDFPALYAGRIRPILAAHAPAREAGQRRGRIWAGTVAAAGATLTLIGMLKSAGNAPVTLATAGFGAFVTLIAAAIVRRQAVDGLDRVIAAEVGTVLAEAALGARFLPQPPADFLPLDRITHLSLIGSGGVTALGHALEGTCRGVAFRVAAAERVLIHRGSDDNDRPAREVIFAGLVLQLSVPQEMPVIIIRRRRASWEGFFASALLQGLERIDLGTPAFNDLHEVWTDDPFRAAERLGPDFPAMIEEMAPAITHRPADFAVAFTGRQCFIAAPRRAPFIDLSSAGQSDEAYAVTCQAALEDIMLPARLIARLVPQG
jgi:hypothetical protein